MPAVYITTNCEGDYILDGCPKGYKSPMACQAKGCPYWEGYVFENACLDGFKNYKNSVWRRMIHQGIEVANYVLCSKEVTDAGLQERIPVL
jgi:hypothetical protein